MDAAPPRIFYGWVVLTCVSTVLLATYGVQYAFGVFVTAMLYDLGWSRTSLAGAFSLYSLVYIGLSVVSGHLTDRVGPRWVIAFGGACLGSGMILVSRIQAPWQLYLWYGGLAGIGMSAAYVPCTVTAVKWFQRRRGLAVGIAGASASLGIAGLAPLSEALIARFGWRQTYLVFGVGVVVLLNVLACFVVRDPDTLGLQPDGAPPRTPSVATTVPAEAPDHAWTLREAIRTPAFWLLASVMVGSVLTIPAVYVHLPQYTSDLHLAIPRSGGVMLVGLGALLGNLTLSGLADRLGCHRALVGSLLLGTLALGGLTVARGVALLTVAAVCFGVYYGTFVSLFPAVMADFFGRRHAGTLTGCSFALGSVTAALGPVLMGWVADRTGQYMLALLGGTVVNGLVVLLCMLARPPVRHPQHPVV